MGIEMKYGPLPERHPSWAEQWSGDICSFAKMCFVSLRESQALFKVCQTSLTHFTCNGVLYTVEEENVSPGFALLLHLVVSPQK